MVRDRARDRRFGWIVGLVTLAILTLTYSRSSYPPLPGTLTFELTLPPGTAGQHEPVLCTGMHGEGDMLAIRYINQTTAEFTYDHWGFGGPRSQPVTFEPDTRHTLRVTMPSLTTFQKPPPGARAPLVLEFDGREILRADVAFHARLPSQVFFGANAIGASTVGAFRGEIRTDDRRKPRGDLVSYFSTSELVRTWVRQKPVQAALVFLLSMVAGVVAWLTRVWRLTEMTSARLGGRVESVRRVLAPHRWFVGATIATSFCYAWVLGGGSFALHQRDDFGVFYDYQAESLLRGRLDVPEEAIGPEAFQARGKLYGYFGPTPALLRIPFAMAGVAFGKLSRWFMLLYFLGSLVAAYLILRDALRLTAPASPEPKIPSPFASLVLVGSVGLGSTLFFLGTRSFVFHEAILCGVVFALWSCWCALRHLEVPAGRWWIGALVTGVLSVHARPPTGLFALTFLGCVAIVHLGRSLLAGDSAAANRLPAGSYKKPITIGVLCALGFLSLQGLAYLKFGTFDPAPLRMSRPYENPARLQKIEGRSFHLANVPFNFDTYLLRPNFRLEPRFPWIYLGNKKPRRSFPNAKIDLPDFTLALPYAMPSLFALAVFGCLGAVITRPATRPAVGALWAAALPMTIALFAAVATAQRYTGDFCPFLICASAYGLAALESASAQWRRWLRGAVAVATLGAIFVTVALTLEYQGVALWGVPEQTRRNYRDLQRRIDGFLGLPVPDPAAPLPPIRTEADL